MPLFKSNNHNDAAVNNTSSRHSTTDSRSSSSPSRKKSIFSSNRQASTDSSDSDRSSRRNGSGGGFLGMGRNRGIDNDPSIRNARQMVSEAEVAEKQADRALVEARNRVRLAHDHVAVVEREAVEDARRAKAKQAEAKMIHKSAKGLGRHGA